MARESLGTSFQLGNIRGRDSCAADKLHKKCRSGWYFSQEEIDRNSPSRRDGVDLRKETELRATYCSFLQDLGVKLGMPQVAIATAIMYCHRFYLHQSHARNEWQTVATACLFLASKVEETPCGLDKVAVVAYKTMYRRNPAAAARINQKDVLEKQKSLILIGEKLLLCTIRFDFNILHPYDPLYDAMTKLGITQKEVRRVALDFVNRGLVTTLCLQYKPHYIAAGALYLAAKCNNLKLPSERGYVWWHEFDITPQRLQDVIYQMGQLLDNRIRQPTTCPAERPVETLAAVKELSSSPDSVLMRPASYVSSSSPDFDADVGTRKPEPTSSSNAEEQIFMELQCVPRNLEGQIAITEQGETSARYINETMSNPDHVVHGETSRKDAYETRTRPDHVANGLDAIDMHRIREIIKKKKRQREISKWTVTTGGTTEDAWIEKELEMGIELEADAAALKRRLDGL